MPDIARVYVIKHVCTIGGSVYFSKIYHKTFQQYVLAWEI